MKDCYSPVAVGDCSGDDCCVGAKSSTAPLGKISVKTTCATCSFAFAALAINADFRECRHHSPQQSPKGPNAFWPVVHETNWCGDWAPTTATPDPGAFPGPASGMPPNDTADMNAEQLRDFIRTIGIDLTQPADANPTPMP